MPELTCITRGQHKIVETNKGARQLRLLTDVRIAP